MIKIVGLNRKVFQQLRRDGLENAQVIDRYRGVLSGDAEIVTIQLPEGMAIEYRNFCYEDVLIRDRSKKFYLCNNEFEHIEIS